MKRMIKWLLIVCSNAALGFFLAMESGESLVGILFGILTWIVIYTVLDSYLITTGRQKLSWQLTLSTCLRIPLQSVLYIDMCAGIAAGFTIELGLGVIEGDVSANTLSYLYTLFTGFYLSLVCGVIMFFINLVFKKKPALFRALGGHQYE